MILTSRDIPDSKVHGVNMGLNWVLSAPDGPHVGPMNHAIRERNGTSLGGLGIIDYITTKISPNDDIIMGAMASQISSFTIVYSIVYSGTDQSKHQSSASLAFVWWVHRGPMNSAHKWPVTRKMFPFDDVIIVCYLGPRLLTGTT